LLAVLRFLWNATRGHRLAPWRSEFLRWRIETYSGMHAETMTTKDILGFVWTSRWELLAFLAWVGRLDPRPRSTKASLNPVQHASGYGGSNGMERPS
jgi:hypothetical protein